MWIRTGLSSLCAGHEPTAQPVSKSYARQPGEKSHTYEAGLERSILPEAFRDALQREAEDAAIENRGLPWFQPVDIDAKDQLGILAAGTNLKPWLLAIIIRNHKKHPAMKRPLIKLLYIGNAKAKFNFFTLEV